MCSHYKDRLHAPCWDSMSHRTWYGCEWNSWSFRVMPLHTWFPKSGVTKENTGEVDFEGHHTPQDVGSIPSMSCNPLTGIGYKALQYHEHDDFIKWKHFPRYWPFVRGIHWSPVNSPHKGQWRGTLMFSLICTWTNGWVNNREAGDLRRHRTHYDVTVMTVMYKCTNVHFLKSAIILIHIFRG